MSIISEAISARTLRREKMTSTSLAELLGRLAHKCNNANTKKEQFCAIMHFLELIRAFPDLSPKKYDVKVLHHGYKTLNDKFADCMNGRRKNFVRCLQKEMLLKMQSKNITNQLSQSKTKSINANKNAASMTNNFKKLTISSE